MKKVMVILPSVSIPGGRERVMSNFANHLYQDFDFLFVVMDNNLEPFYPIPKEVKLIGIDSYFMTDKSINKNKTGYINDIFKIRKIIKTYSDFNIIIGLESTYINTFVGLAILGMRKYFIAYEHTVFHVNDRHSFWTFLRNTVYKLRVNKVITLTNREQKEFERLVPAVEIIPNALTFSNTKAATLDNKVILAVGRFTNEKGFDLLLESMVCVFERHSDWKLNLIGEGIEEEILRGLLIKFNIEGNVIIDKPSNQIQQRYLDSSLYVLSSRMEAFPMVLIESMSFGLPCVCFDCVTGPREIVNDGEDGFLVPPEDVKLLSNYILKLIEDNELRKEMGRKAFKNIQRYSPDIIYKKWQWLLNSIN
jgi:glycosyltransferase involved in cell wall biosynthesis